MPSFDDAVTTAAPIEEVFKLLYDPARIGTWLQGVDLVEPHGHDGRGDFTVYPAGFPDYPMPQGLRTGADGRTVVFSCLMFALEYAWRLEPAGADGDATRIAVRVEIPEAEAERLEEQRALIGASLLALAAVAERSATAAPRARG